MFLDKITLKLKAGDGGDGIIAWRREKYIPKGGPSGGNGGDGGSIILKTDPQLSSLEEFRNKKIIKAENGIPGCSSNKQGKKGEDLILKLPIGTLIKEARSKEILIDFTRENQSHTICQGGKGGKGNTFFKSSTNQAPFLATEGTEGEEKEIEFELKLIADIGLLGLPNAGKSTLLSKITKAKTKMADYPFTTLSPKIGTLEFEDFSRIYIADIPGIVKDAHKNKGLGLSFLKHIERTNLLLYVLDASIDPISDFKIIQKELKKYDKKLLEKPYLVALNKMDLKESQDKKTPFSKKAFNISALKETGLKELKLALKEFSNF